MANPIGNIDMGNKTSMSASLSDGAAFYVALQAYDNFGSSGFSNIEYFIISTSPDLLDDDGDGFSEGTPGI